MRGESGPDGRVDGALPPADAGVPAEVPATTTMADRLRLVLGSLQQYAIVVGEAARTPRFTRIDLVVSPAGMGVVRALDNAHDLRVYGDDRRGSVNTAVPIYLWADDSDSASRYLRLAMGETVPVLLFGVRMRGVPDEPAKPPKGAK